VEVRKLEKDNVWIIMYNGEPLTVSFNRADIEELFMDLVMEIQYDMFCWSWLYFQDSLEISMKCSDSDGSYWIANVIGWR
jgi:hypothetical protein